MTTVSRGYSMTTLPRSMDTVLTSYCISGASSAKLAKSQSKTKDKKLLQLLKTPKRVRATVSLLMNT